MIPMNVETWFRLTQGKPIDFMDESSLACFGAVPPTDLLMMAPEDEDSALWTRAPMMDKILAGAPYGLFRHEDDWNKRQSGILGRLGGRLDICLIKDFRHQEVESIPVNEAIIVVGGRLASRIMDTSLEPFPGERDVS